MPVTFLIQDFPEDQIASLELKKLLLKILYFNIYFDQINHRAETVGNSILQW